MKVLILAGGYATRLWPLTDKRAKPLLLVDGKTILAHILEKIPTEFETFILTNKKFEQDFKQEIQKLNRENTTIFCEDSLSDGEKLGALGAISLFLQDQKIDESVLVFAGDNILPELNVDDLLCQNDNAHIAVRSVPTLHDARKFGVVELGDALPFSKEGAGMDSLEKNPSVPSIRDSSLCKREQKSPLSRVRTFEEKPEHPKSTTVMTGFLSLGKDLLPILHAYAKKSPDALGGIFMELLAQKKEILATTVGGEWFDVGSFESYLDAHQKLQTKDVQCGENRKEIQNEFQGKVYIGDDCILENCRITESIIYPGCTLKNCHISQSVIDRDCVLSGLDINRKLIRQKTYLEGEK